MIIRLFNQIKCRIYIESVGSLIIRLFSHSIRDLHPPVFDHNTKIRSYVLVSAFIYV